MKRHLFLFFILCLLLRPVWLSAQTKEIKRKVTFATRNFVEMLSPSQLQKAQYSFNDSNRLRWSNEPQKLYPSRVGLTVERMNETQKQALHQLLQTVLSEQGYLKALNVMRLDAYLHEKAAGLGNREGSGKYWFALFGRPDTARAWSWRFEGHHLSLNFTCTPSGIFCTPMFYGADPAVFTKGNLAGWENMFAETQLARQFFHTLNTQQQKMLLVDDHIPKSRDILTRTGKERFLQQFQGISFSRLSSAQQQLLKRLVRVYFNNLSPLLAGFYLEKLQWQKLYIGWWGSGKEDRPFYYRIHSPDCIIEYCSRLNDPNHIHTLVRFLPMDFGGLF